MFSRSAEQNPYTEMSTSDSAHNDQRNFNKLYQKTTVERQRLYERKYSADIYNSKNIEGIKDTTNADNSRTVNDGDESINLQFEDTRSIESRLYNSKTTDLSISSPEKNAPLTPESRFMASRKALELRVKESKRISQISMPKLYHSRKGRYNLTSANKKEGRADDSTRSNSSIFYIDSSTTTPLSHNDLPETHSMNTKNKKYDYSQDSIEDKTIVSPILLLDEKSVRSVTTDTKSVNAADGKSGEDLKVREDLKVPPSPSPRLGKYKVFRHVLLFSYSLRSKMRLS